MDKTTRITVNGDPFAVVGLTREAALSYLPEEQRRAVPDGWIPDPSKLTISHLIMLQARARTKGLWGRAVYRMNSLAVIDVEAALVASKVPAEYASDERLHVAAWAPGNCMMFRGIPVIERIRVAMQAKLNEAGYILMDSSSGADDWEEHGAATGLNPNGGWAFVVWLDDSTCPSCSGAGVYEAELTNCRSEEQAKAMLEQHRKAHP